MRAKRAKRGVAPKTTPDLSGLGGERLRPTAAGQSWGGDGVAAVAGATSPARSCPGLVSTRAERVAWCIQLMASGYWSGYASRLPLTMLWEVDDSTVRHYAAEASRTLALDDDGREQAKITHAAALLDMSRRAENTFNAMTGMPDFASAIKARETAAKFQGIVLATGVELTGKGGGPVELSLDDVDEALRSARDNAREAAEDEQPVVTPDPDTDDDSLDER